MMEITAFLAKENLAAPTLKKGKASNLISNLTITCKPRLFRDYILHKFSCQRDK